MLDPNLNRIPESVKHIHLIAACGTAMGALASLLTEQGYRVTGSDARVYPPMSTFLEERGIRVESGFVPERILDGRPDLVVVGNAVTRMNPEAVALKEAEIPYCSLPQALNRFLGEGRKTLVVTGTHGKTTTTALLSHVLTVAGEDPSWMVGGIVNGVASNFRLGTGDCFVVEGDEYDTAFFDKDSKFHHFTPYRAIVTGVEFDHADIFDSLEAIESTFSRFLSRLPEDGQVMSATGYPALERVIRHSGIPSERVVTYGGGSAKWQARLRQILPVGQRFTVRLEGEDWLDVEMPIPGEHNRMNALAVIAVCHSLGIDRERIREGLRTFPGVMRRQEVRGVACGVVVMDDFAHHPTAVAATIEAMKPHAANRLWAIFEPRTNTSMRNVFQKRYSESFDHADRICIREVPAPEKVPEAERFSSLKLVEDLESRGLAATLHKDAGEIVETVVASAEPGDLLLVMSNGGFEGIHERLLGALEKRGG